MKIEIKLVLALLLALTLSPGCSNKRETQPHSKNSFPAVELKLPDWVEQAIASDWGDPENLRLPDTESQMKFAIWLSRKNVEHGTGGPFGAAVFEVETGRLVAPGVNVVVPQHSSAAHGEFMALAIAQKRLSTYDLSSKSLGTMRLVTSAQPCIQCFGMLHWSGVREMIYGASGEDVETITGFDEGPLPTDWENRLKDRLPLPPVTVQGKVLREQATDVLKLYMSKAGKVYNAGSN